MKIWDRQKKERFNEFEKFSQFRDSINDELLKNHRILAKKWNWIERKKEYIKFLSSRNKSIENLFEKFDGQVLEIIKIIDKKIHDSENDELKSLKFEQLIKTASAYIKLTPELIELRKYLKIENSDGTKDNNEIIDFSNINDSKTRELAHQLINRLSKMKV